jgi:hypothetical protein
MTFLGNASHGYSWKVSTVQTTPSSAVEIIPAVSGKHTVIDKIIYSCSEAGTMFVSSGATPITIAFNFGANGGVALDELKITCGQSEAVTFTTTDSGNHTIMMRYYRI